jgi:hypothetical protein
MKSGSQIKNDDQMRAGHFSVETRRPITAAQNAALPVIGAKAEHQFIFTPGTSPWNNLVKLNTHTSDGNSTGIMRRQFLFPAATIRNNIARR